MSEELFYKIVLLRQTPYFKDLSPYSLVTIASNVEVKEMKYGEVLIQQGDFPEALYILAYGNLKAVYICPEIQTTEVSQFARKVLRKQPKPMKHGPIES
jgi:CRP-like cAMP-binding protein